MNTFQVNLFTSFPHDILGRRYTGGWSEVLGASKYFYNFKIRSDELGYIICIHPITGAKLWYTRIPMGTANFPAITHRVGLVILHQMALEDKNFSVTLAHNAIGDQMMGDSHQPN